MMLFFGVIPLLRQVPNKIQIRLLVTDNFTHFNLLFTQCRATLYTSALALPIFLQID
jgi:hypothetical protein